MDDVPDEADLMESESNTSTSDDTETEDEVEVQVEVHDDDDADNTEPASPVSPPELISREPPLQEPPQDAPADHLDDLTPGDDDESEFEGFVPPPRKHCRDVRTPKKKAIADHKTAGRYFQAGNYGQAEALYTKAIVADPTAPLLYTNRAMATIKLETMMDAVVADCDESLRLLAHNMKAHYYKAQALLSLGQPGEALESAKKAYELAYESGDRTWERSLGNIVSVVLNCKKAVWEKKEAKRIRDEGRIRKEVEELMRAQMERDVSAATDEFEQEKLEKEWEGKIGEFGERWDYKPPRREVPDWMIDDITFAIMYDPVIVSALLFISLRIY